MSDHKDIYELYQSVLDEVHAPDELVQRIKSADTKHLKSRSVKKIRLISVSAAAACLAVVILITVIIGSFTGKGDSFVFKAYAAEIGGESFVEITKVAPVFQESGGVVDGDNSTHVYKCLAPFALYCDGRNIKSVTYTADNAVFLFPYATYAADFREQYPDEAAASDKITEKTESSHKIENSKENDKQYASYTVSFDDQIKPGPLNFAEMDRFPIQLLTSISSEDPLSKEAKAAMKHLHTGGSVTDESFMNQILNDYRIIYDEMYSKVTITAEITYQDGSTDTASLQLSCLSADMQNGFVIGAKTV